jgi:putative transposase
MEGFHRKPAKGVMHHSDRGSQYASHVFQDKLKEYGMRCSMSQEGNCWDNAEWIYFHIYPQAKDGYSE